MTRSTDPFDELRDQLEEAHATDVAHTNRDQRFQRTNRWRPSRVGVLAVAAVLVTGTAVAAMAPWNPPIGGDHGTDGPTRASGDFPADQAAALSVLRRPQTEADRSPAVLRALRTVGSRLGSGLYVDRIRLLQENPHENVLLLAFRRVGPSEDPDHQTHDGLCVYKAYVNSTRTGTVTSGDEGIPAPTPIAGASCGTLSDVKRGRVSGLVPDGVAQVRLVSATGVRTVDVTNNYYEPLEAATRDGIPTEDPPTAVWLDADGHTVLQADPQGS